MRVLDCYIKKKYYRSLFLTVLEASKSEIKVPVAGFLWGLSFWSTAFLFFGIIIWPRAERREASSFLPLYKCTNPIMMVPPSWTTAAAAAAAAKSLQSCWTLCDPIDGSPPRSPVPGILQARTLERVAISFSNAGKWKVKVKLLSCVWLLATPWTHPPGSSIHGIFQARVLLHPHELINFKKPYLQIPSHWVLGFNMWILGGHKQSISLGILIFSGNSIYSTSEFGAQEWESSQGSI